MSVHATYHGTITDTGGEDCDFRGFVWDTASHGDPGNVAPGASGYALGNWTEGNSYGVDSFSHLVEGLPEGDTLYVRACAHNSAGWSYGGEVSFDTPAPVGWTGKISGVTNPAKIMGVDVANITKVKGVVSA